jgi:predicted component of type VI protein secretion system
MQITLRDGDVVIVGKDIQCANFILSQVYGNISRLHCEIQYDAVYDCYYVTDKSSNGTYISEGHVQLGKEQKIMIPRNTRLVLANEECIILLN